MRCSRPHRCARVSLPLAVPKGELSEPVAAPAAFGELLRQHRLAAGMTQEGLAEQAGLSVHGIQKLEGGATHPYRDTAERVDRFGPRSRPVQPEHGGCGRGRPEASRTPLRDRVRWPWPPNCWQCQPQGLGYDPQLLSLPS